MKYFIDAALRTFAFEDSDTDEFIAGYAQRDWVAISNVPSEPPKPPHNPLTQTVIRDGCELVDGAWQYKWRIDALSAEQIAAAYAATIPQVVTMRQARLALLGAGKLTSVTAAINTLPSPQKEAAQIEWEYSQTVERNRSFVLLLSAALGLTDAQLDALFVTAAGL
jgi:hypothetical protein